MRDRRSVSTQVQETLRNRGREMRKQMSPAELKLWSRLRGDELEGVRFRRRHPVGIFVADFFCPRFNLVVEVDGDSHFDEEAQRYDEERTAYFAGIGLKEIRFTNVDVLKNIENVF